MLNINLCITVDGTYEVKAETHDGQTRREFTPVSDSEPESEEVRNELAAGRTAEFLALSQALQDIYNGPEYANGRPADALPIMRRFHSDYLPPCYPVVLSSAERVAVQEFTHAFRQTARDQNGVDRLDAMQEEFTEILFLLSRTIPALAHAGLARDHAYQQLVLGIMEILLGGLRQLVDIDSRVVASLNSRRAAE